MSKKVKVEGKVYIVPDDATPDEIDEISGGKTAAATKNLDTAIKQYKPPGFLDGLNSSLNFAPNDSGLLTTGKTAGQAIMGPVNEASDAIKGIGVIPKMATVNDDAPNDEYGIGKMTQIPGTQYSPALGLYRMGKGLVGQAKDSLISGYNASKQGEGLPGIALAEAEKAPLIGDLTDKMEHGGGVGAVTQGITRAATLKAPEIGRGIVDRGGQMIVRGTPEELITRATKPSIGLPEYERSVRSILPDISKDSPRTLNELAASADKLRDAKASEYGALKSATGNSPVPTYSVGSAQMKSIPATNRFEDANILSKTAKTAGKYNTTMPVEAADAIRMDTNAKLRDFYNKAGGDQYAALSHPETARIHAVNSGIRDELYDTIKSRTGTDPAPIQETYGHAVDVGDTAARRNTVFSRQQPIPGVQQIAAATGNPIGFGLSKLVSGLNDSDALVNRGIQRYRRSITSPDGRLRLMIGGPMINSANRDQ